MMKCSDSVMPKPSKKPIYLQICMKGCVPLYRELPAPYQVDNDINKREYNIYLQVYFDSSNCIVVKSKSG